MDSLVSFMCGLIGLFSYEVALGAILTMLLTLALGYPTSSWLVMSERTFSIWWFTPFTLDVTFRSAERVRLYLVLEFVSVSIVWRLSSNSSSIFDPCRFSDLALLASAYGTSVPYRC